MGSVYSRDSVYYINMRVNGRRIRKKAGKSKKLAYKLLYDLELKAERNQLGFLDLKDALITDFITQKYLPYCETQHRLPTTQRYRSALHNFITYIQNETKIKNLSDLSTEDIEQFKIHRKKMPVSRNGSDPKKAKKVSKGAKSYTVNFEIMAIKTMLNIAVKWKYLESSPAEGVKPLKTEDVKPRRFLVEAECKKLLKHSSKELYPIFYMLLNTGMRRSELVNLEWTDIDLDKSTIKIRRKEFWKPKTGEREIPISPGLFGVFSNLPKKGDFVFIGDGGRQIGADWLRNQLVKTAKKASIPDLTGPHDLRHTFASRLFEKGVDAPSVQRLMGHSSIETTMIYTHQTSDHLKEAVGKLGY